MAVDDPLGVLEAKAKQLNIINEIYDKILSSSGNVAKAARSFTEEQKKAAQALGLINERNETLLAAEKEIDKMYQRRAEYRTREKNDVGEILSINKKLRDQELQTEKERLVAIEENFKIAAQRKKLLQEELKNRDTLRKEAQDLYRAEQARIDAMEKTGRLEGDALLRARALANKKLLATEQTLDGLERQIKAQDKIANKTKKELTNQANVVEAREKINTGMDTSVGFLDGMIEKTGFFSEKWKTGPLGGITDFIEAGGDMSKLFDELKLKARKINMSNLGANVLTNIIDQTIKFMLEFDKLASSFRKNTGIIDRGFGGMEQSIVNVQRANLRMGVSMDEAFASANALVSGMAEFTSMTDDAQNQVLQATAIMQEFGVSASTTAEIFNNFSKGLGYDSKQLEKLSTQIMGIATSLKVPPQIIAKDFNMASKELMKYGDEMINVFEGLAEQSKQTGLAMNELLGIAKQFDTFEAAGSAVGKLNAILGGPYLNAINMVYASEEERIKALRESIKLSGRQFSELHRYEQQAIATAAGISDMSVAARLFGGTESEFANTRMSMKEMQERAQKAQAVQEKFTQVMQSFAIAMGPVVHVLGDLLEGLVLILNPFTELIDLGNDFGGTANVVVNGVYLIVGSLLLLKKGIIGIQVQTAMMFAGFAAVITGFLVFKNVIEALEGPLKVFVAILGALAVAAAIASIVATGGLSAVPMVAGLQLLGIGAGLGTMAALPSFDGGKEKGTPVRGGAALIAEEDREMVVTEDGSTYMVNSPSVVELGTQDTVYTNAQTEMILNGGGNTDTQSETIAAAVGSEKTQGATAAVVPEMLAAAARDRLEAAKDRALLRESLSAIADLANRPIIAELDGKAVWKNQREYANKDASWKIV